MKEKEEQTSNRETENPQITPPNERGSERIWHRLQTGLEVALVVVPGVTMLGGLLAYGEGMITVSQLIGVLQLGFLSGLAAGVGAALIKNTRSRSFRS